MQMRYFEIQIYLSFLFILLRFKFFNYYISMKVAVVGATGLVGSTMLKILAERDFPVTELIPVASERSVGNKVVFKGKEYSVVNADTAIAMKPALALFSAGGSIS